MPRLIRCKCCSSAVSCAASVCPYCGNPVQTVAMGFAWGLAQIIVGALGVVLIGVGLAYGKTYRDPRDWLALIGAIVLILAGVMRPPTSRRR
jgi:hypothetical protein